MSDCCCTNNLVVDQKVYDLENKILLMGNPNVGKSVFFSALTGVHVMSSNYAGTTVTYTKSKLDLNNEEYQLIDVPGTYSLTATSQAEQVAVSFMNSGAKAIVCVLDATNLTRNLNLALEVMQYNVPVVFALNLVDIAKRKGIIVDAQMLSQELNAPVIETVAVKNIGLSDVSQKICELINQDNKEVSSKIDIKDLSQKDLWDLSESIAQKCTSVSNKELTFFDKLGDDMVKPMPGIPIALGIILTSLGLIVGGGKAFRVVFFLPLINNALVPFIKSIVSSFNLPTLLNNILIGEYGICVIGLEWPISLIMPYVTLFYIVFTFLEDCGFLPRIAVLFDNIMRKMGVQGGSLITLVMGFGCAVPAIIGTRNATTRKERIIITSMVCFAVPCISQSAALLSLLSSQSIFLALALLVVSFVVIFAVGFVTGKLLKGNIDPIVIEIPHLLVPEKNAYFKKLLVRLKSFLLEAEGPMMIAIVIAAILKESGLLDAAAVMFEPLVSGLLGLPSEAVILLLLGVIRREMAVAPLLDMALTPLQLFIGATVALLYLPCLSVFGVIAKEFNSKVAVAIGVSVFVTAMLLGGFINLVGQLIF